MRARAFLSSTLLGKSRKDEHLCFMMWQEHRLLDMAQTVTVNFRPKIKKLTK